MLGRLFSTFKKLIHTSSSDATRPNSVNTQTNNPEMVNIKVSHSLTENESIMRSAFKDTNDFLLYQFEIHEEVDVLLAYLDGMIDKDIINRDIVNSLLARAKDDKIKSILKSPPKIKSILPVSDVQETKGIADIIENILDGYGVLFINGLDTAFIIGIEQIVHRAVEEPDSESLVRGPKEGFIENIKINRALLRKKLKNRNLVFEKMKIGKQTKTHVEIAYIDGIVNNEVLAEVRRRLSHINTDAILESGYLEQFIEDSPFSPIATIANTQKPDIVAAKILEGRVAIFCDGTPHVLTVPHLFIETIQNAEDYYIRPFYALLLRLLRLFAMAIAIMLPALYVALSTFHAEMIPTVLLLNMTANREGIPFPTVVEALLMTFMFEILRESGTRLPRRFSYQYCWCADYRRGCRGRRNCKQSYGHCYCRHRGMQLYCAKSNRSNHYIQNSAIAFSWHNGIGRHYLRVICHDNACCFAPILWHTLYVITGAL